MATKQYDGKLKMDADKEFYLPPKYRDMSQFVVRMPGKTEVQQGRAVTWYASDNDHLEPGEVEVKPFGEPAELYLIDNYDDYAKESNVSQGQMVKNE